MGLSVLVLALITGFLVGCCCAHAPPAPPGPAQAASFDTTKAVPSSVVSDTITLIEMRNVHFRLSGDLALEIHRLSGAMIPQGRSYVYFDDPSGYVIRVQSILGALAGDVLPF